jgi:hypothetical protein
VSGVVVLVVMYLNWAAIPNPLRANPARRDAPSWPELAGNVWSGLEHLQYG